MFQSTGVHHGRHRPPVIHAYGAKVGMVQALRSIAVEGWVSLAVVMVDTKGKKSMWTDLELRPVTGGRQGSRLAAHVGKSGTTNQCRSVLST